ncbi:MAG: hypothetical protein D6689_07590, partial [Deltaproteobacteria bacterium]
MTAPLDDARAAAAEGDPIRVAVCFDRAAGAGIDPREAFDWFLLLVEAGDIDRARRCAGAIADPADAAEAAAVLDELASPARAADAADAAPDDADAARA